MKQKYKVDHAYYFLGYVQDGRKDLYNEIQEAGFILKFREHNSLILDKKKGKVDTDLVFAVMKRLIRNNDFEKVVLMSGGGDYKQLVDFLIKENKFLKILFPNQAKASSLYRDVDLKFRANLSQQDVIRK